MNFDVTGINWSLSDSTTKSLTLTLTVTFVTVGEFCFVFVCGSCADVICVAFFFVSAECGSEDETIIYIFMMNKLRLSQIID